MSWSVRLLQLIPVRSVRSRIYATIADREFHRELRQARAEGDQERAMLLLHSRSDEDWMDHQERELEFTRRMRIRASRLRVPLPPLPERAGEDNEYWMLSSSFGGYFLTEIGVDTVRESIRKEERWRMERLSSFVTIITALTGLLGALVGVLAVLGN